MARRLEYSEAPFWSTLGRHYANLSRRMNTEMNPRPGISLIIPCWKDVTAAMKLARQFAHSSFLAEVIIAGVRGEDPPIAEGRIKVCLADRPGRGRQMNLGAETAGGDVLLFHHVDSQLTDEHLGALQRIMSGPAVVGGAFYRKFDERHPRLRWAESIERWHSRAFGTLYGDQSIFVRRAHFLQLGGFASLPLMEDVEFSPRLRRSGRIVLLDPAMSSSPARQIEQGAWRTTLRNMLFLLLFRCGVPADFLHAWYYRRMPEIVQGGTTSPTEGSPRRRALVKPEPEQRLT